MTVRYSGQTTTTLAGLQVPLPNVSISVYDSQGALVTLTADGGGPLTNPFDSDGQGNFAFNVAATGLYDLIYSVGGKQVFRENGVQVGTGDSALTVFVKNIIGATSFVVTSSPGQSVSTRGLLAGIATPTVGMSARLTEAGRGGVFIAKLWSDYSAIGALDTTYQGLIVRSTADTTIAWVREDYIDRPGFYQANWWGYAAGTDSAAILNAIFGMWEALGGGELLVPNGTMSTSIALQDTGGANAQIVLPTVGDNVVALRLRAACPQMAGDPNTGVIWQSTLTTGAGGNVVSSRFTLLNLFIDGITIRCPQNPVLTGFNAGGILYSEGNLRVDIPGVQAGSPFLPLTITQPTEPTSYGFKSPTNATAALCLLKVQVVGYYTGVLIGELFQGKFLAVGCINGYLSQTGSHYSGPWYGQIIACKGDMFFDGLTILRDCGVDIEHNPTVAEGGIAPNWVKPRTTSLKDTSGAARGRLVLGFHDDAIDPLTFDATLTNLEVVRVTDVTQEPLTSFGFPYNTVTTDSNRSSINFLRSFNGGIPYDLRGNGISSGTLWAQMTYNTSAAGPNDFRLCQVKDVTDGSASQGKRIFSIFKNQVEKQPLALTYTGPTYPDIVTAADDTAAAAAGVNLKGLYMHSDGTPRIRVT